MSDRSTGKQMSINMIASLFSFAVNMGINFFLTPYLVKTLGTEAYGYIGLANNFVQYSAIITAALNSISGRFISIEYHKGKKKEASQIFNSVLISNLILAAVLLLLTVGFTMNLESFLNIPKNLIYAVKTTFAVTFFTYVISVVTAIFTTAAFVKNRMDLNAVRDIIGNFIKAAAVIVLFLCFPPKLFYLSLATLISGLFLLASNLSLKKKLLPEIRFAPGEFRGKTVIMLLKSGIWQSFAQLCNVLMTGLDLLISNLTLGAALTGTLSIAKTVPVCIGNLILTIGNVFTPHFTIKYAEKDIDGLVKEVKLSSKITSLIMMVPIAGFMAFGNEFYTLWQPTKTAEEIRMIQVLSVLTCLTYVFSCMTQCQMMLFTVCNRLRLPVLTNFLIGVVSLLIVCLSHASGRLGENNIYLIAGVSSILLAMRYAVFVPVYAAHILKRKKTEFLPNVFRAGAVFCGILLLFRILRTHLTMNTWGSFLISCLLAGLLGYGMTAILLFSSEERKMLLRKVHRR